ncbi:MAG: hypothetical protein IJF18_04555 [Oscillospiraceae bacterium]|nr:hypothetical protein [Oscillospiraceae bacterium]
MIYLNKKTAAALAALLLLCGCSRQTAEEETDDTSVIFPPVVTTAPEADHSLMRFYTINEVFADLHADGRDFTFPVSEREFEEGGVFEDCTLTANSITFPDGSSLTSTLTDYGGGAIEAVKYICAEKGTAPRDFTVCGLVFGMTRSQVYSDFGIPDSVLGDPEKDYGVLTYVGAGSQLFFLEFENNRLVRMVFQQ